MRDAGRRAVEKNDLSGGAVKAQACFSPLSSRLHGGTASKPGTAGRTEGVVVGFGQRPQSPEPVGNHDESGFVVASACPTLTNPLLRGRLTLQAAAKSHV